MSESLEPLMTPADLAVFLGLKEATVRTLASRDPDKLPPRCRAVSKPRWVPSVVRQWAERHSAPTKTRVGRPRLSV